MAKSYRIYGVTDKGNIRKPKPKKCPLCGKGFNKTSKTFEYSDGSKYHQKCVEQMNKREGFDKYM